jgi:hypothetical protein
MDIGIPQKRTLWQFAKRFHKVSDIWIIER